MALGRRGWSLYRGFRHALTGPSIYAAQVDLRALLDVTILVRWIEADPPLRLELWMTEDDRDRIAWSEGWREAQRRRGQSTEGALTAEEIKELRELIAEVRARDRDAGIGVPENGSLLPSQAQMAQQVPDLFETYHVAYRSLSPTTHAGARSFAADVLEERKDGVHIVANPVFDEASLRSLAVPTVLMLFASVSRQAGLGIEDECDRLRLTVVGLAPRDTTAQPTSARRTASH